MYQAAVRQPAQAERQELHPERTVAQTLPARLTTRRQSLRKDKKKIPTEPVEDEAVEGEVIDKDKKE